MRADRVRQPRGLPEGLRAPRHVPAEVPARRQARRGRPVAPGARAGEPRQAAAVRARAYFGMHFPAVIAGGGTLSPTSPTTCSRPGTGSPSSRRRRRCSARTRTSPPGSRTARSTSPAPSRPTPARPSNNGIEVDWTVPKEGAKIDTDGLWIPKGLPENELYWAKQYINFAISPEGQQAWLDAARPARRRAGPQAAGRSRRRPVLSDHATSSSPSCSACRRRSRSSTSRTGSRSSRRSCRARSERLRIASFEAPLRGAPSGQARGQALRMRRFVFSTSVADSCGLSGTKPLPSS